MDDNTAALALAVLALATACLAGKQVERLRRDIDSLVDGDIETIKLRRKLERRSDG